MILKAPYHSHSAKSHIFLTSNWLSTDRHCRGHQIHYFREFLIPKISESLKPLHTVTVQNHTFLPPMLDTTHDIIVEVLRLHWKSLLERLFQCHQNRLPLSGVFICVNKKKSWDMWPVWKFIFQYVTFSAIWWALITVYSLHFILDLLGTVALLMHEINHATCLNFLVTACWHLSPPVRKVKNTYETIFAP